MYVRMAVWRGSKVYSEEKLWQLTGNDPVYTVPFHMLSKNLDLHRWTVYVNGHKQYVTPNEVLNDPAISPKDFKGIVTADLEYPILVYNDNGFLDVLDGLHRLALLARRRAPEVHIRFVTRAMLDKATVPRG